MKVTVWNEYVHEFISEKVREIYPTGIHNTIGDFLKEEGHEVTTTSLDSLAVVEGIQKHMVEHGHTPVEPADLPAGQELTDDILNSTDVLIWWGHIAHHEVSDELVEKIQNRVLNGMGLIVLHSGHFSKIFKKLMGTSCDLKWRDDDKERIWVVDPTHPIAEGLPEFIDVGDEEMYGEHFDIPAPDELVLVSWFKGGEIFRSGCTFKRGNGKIFYFRPGHETNPTYHHPQVQQVIKNAVKWAKPTTFAYPKYGHADALEK